MNVKIVLCCLFLLSGTINALSQKTDRSRDLLIEAKKNYQSLKVFPEKAIGVANNNILKASPKGKTEAELYDHLTQCAYYEKTYDFSNMMASANLMYRKAEVSNNLQFQALAKNYLFKAYAFSDVYDKALKELEEGLVIIGEADAKDSLTIDVKSNLYISMSNYFSLKKNPERQLKYIKLSMLEHEKFSNVKNKQRLEYIDMSNLATVYNELDVDSAVYYAENSIAKDKGFNMGDVQFSNLIVLGQSSLKRKNYKKAIFYFRKAERIKNYKNHLNVSALYDDMINAYTNLNQSDNVKNYEAKRDSLKLNISESQNKSLHSILQSKEERNTYSFIYVLLVVVAIIILLFFALRRRNTQLQDSFFENHTVEMGGQKFSKLLKMVKNNDLAFMPFFNECFPKFSNKLTEINPKIIQSEIEFCALLKLNISTKDIGKYKNLAYRTVQNKKYLIRKKLDIPAEVDIYQWFSNI